MQSRDYLNNLVQIRIDELQQDSGSPQSTNVIESISSVIEKELDNAAIDVVRQAPKFMLFGLIQDGTKAHRKDGARDLNTRVVFNSDYSGVIVLPVDFYHFVSLKMSDWSVPVTELHPYGGVEYQRQKNSRITQGNYDVPVGIFLPFKAYTTEETNPYDVANTFENNVTISDLYGGNTVDSYAITTGDILVCSGQTNTDENGIYRANASGAPDLIGDLDDLTPDTPNAAIEFHRSKSKSATIEHLHYIPRIEAEEITDELIDPLTWFCASRVMVILQEFNLAQAAEAKAKETLQNQSKGQV